jgi:hypothetical protein
MTAVASPGVLFGPSGPGRTASSPRGRVCQAEGCLTLLSIYNHAPWCSLHEQPASRAGVSVRR